MYYKHPKTYHLPWSKGITDDDKVVDSLDQFRDKTVVVTEKMDGENTTMYQDHIHARSIDSRSNFTRDWVKGLHATLRNYIPSGYRIVGENLWAEHSIRYENLRSYFYLFAVFDNNNVCLSWDDTLNFSFHMPTYVPVPRVLYLGPFDEKKIKKIKVDRKRMEGYVIRNIGRFHYDDFSSNVAKYVRKGHVQTDKHWLKNARQNGKLVKT